MKKFKNEMNLLKKIFLAKCHIYFKRTQSVFIQYIVDE